MTDAVVIGAGPAGLMAAEELGKAGLSVIVADAMPSVGRKFLMAGKSGLNLTKEESEDAFRSAFGPEMPMALSIALDRFGPKEVVDWAEALGQPLFVGSTGRVFPKVMKASPLLRAWLSRLADLGVEIRMKCRWVGWSDDALIFEQGGERIEITSKVTVLALGGKSWKRLGSDGAWAAHLPSEIAPFAPTNVGFRVKWSEHMAPHFGKPVKAVAVYAGSQMSRGEFVLNKRGIEGGGVYEVSRHLRDGQPLTLDLMPDWTIEKVAQALKRPRGKYSLSNHLRKALKLDAVRLSLLNEFGRPFPEELASLIKRLPVKHQGPNDIDEAISTAGGVRFSEMTEDQMLHDRPGVFCAGEMLDWEAPTGGYLITACLATGRRAGEAAADFLKQKR